MCKCRVRHPASLLSGILNLHAEFPSSKGHGQCRNCLHETIFSKKDTITDHLAMLISVNKTLSMKHAFTQLQLTRLVYGETTKAETDLLLELVDTLPQIAETYEELKAGRDALGTIPVLPSERTINRILAYSASTLSVSAS